MAYTRAEISGQARARMTDPHELRGPQACRAETRFQARPREERDVLRVMVVVPDRTPDATSRRTRIPCEHDKTTIRPQCLRQREEYLLRPRQVLDDVDDSDEVVASIRRVPLARRGLGRRRNLFRALGARRPRSARCRGGRMLRASPLGGHRPSTRHRAQRIPAFRGCLVKRGRGASCSRPAFADVARIPRGSQTTHQPEP